MPAFNDILTNKYFQAAMWVLACLILIKLTDHAFRKYGQKKGNKIKASFMKGLVKIIIVFITFIQIASLSNLLSGFASTILMSSSLLVVVLGFIFQEGLSNIVHGFIITMFKPFDVGDRIQVFVGGETISGYVKSMTLRHTIVTNIIDNAESIIPNALIDKATIKNLTTQRKFNRYPLIVNITYECAMKPGVLEQAKQIISESILEHPKTVDKRTDKTKPHFVKVELAESGVELTVFVDTDTVEENIVACSEIREVLLRKFHEAGIEFAYRHLELSGSIELNPEEVSRIVYQSSKKNTRSHSGTTEGIMNSISRKLGNRNKKGR